MAEQLLKTPASFEREADKRLFLALRRHLWEYEPLRATRPELRLAVNHGTVRLNGRVRTQAMKEIVGYLCQREDGVAVVRNDLVSDTEVAREVADVLAADEELAPLCLRVDVRAGIATLSGDVTEAVLEGRAIEAARGATTVLEVVSEIAVRRMERPPTTPPAKPAEQNAASPSSTDAPNPTGG